MRHRKKNITLDRARGARRRLIRNLLREIVMRERITTTATKARTLKPVVEHLLAVARLKNLHARRQLLAVTGSEEVTRRLLTIAERDGEHSRVRIVPLGHRVGDGAPLERIELLRTPHDEKHV